MDINPISLQMVVPRATDVSHVQHNINHEANVQQDVAMMRGQGDAQMKMETVQTRDEAEDGRIKEDPNREGSGRGYSGKRRNKNSGEESEEDESIAVDALRGRNIDISF